MPRRLSAVLRIALVAGCLAYAFWDIDLAELGRTLARYAPWKMAVVLALSGLAYLCLAQRLSMLLGYLGRPIRLGPALCASLFALGMNNLLPARLGEVAKVLYLRRVERVESACGLGAVFWERFTDLHALFLLALAMLASLDEVRVIGPLGGALVIGWLGVLWLRVDPGPLLGLVGRLRYAGPRRFLLEVIGHLRRGIGGRTAAGLVAWTAALWLLYALQVVLVVVWVAAIPLGAEEVLVVFLLATFGMAVPVSPGGLGVYESMFVLSLGWFGVAPEQALAAGLASHMLQYVPTTVAAAVILLRQGNTPGEYRAPLDEPASSR